MFFCIVSYGVLLAVVGNLEVCYLAQVDTCVLEWEYECTYVVHLMPPPSGMSYSAFTTYISAFVCMSIFFVLKCSFEK